MKLSDVTMTIGGNRIEPFGVVRPRPRVLAIFSLAGGLRVIGADASATRTVEDNASAIQDALRGLMGAWGNDRGLIGAAQAVRGALAKNSIDADVRPRRIVWERVRGCPAHPRSPEQLQLLHAAGDRASEPEWDRVMRCPDCRDGIGAYVARQVEI